MSSKRPISFFVILALTMGLGTIVIAGYEVATALGEVKAATRKAPDPAKPEQPRYLMVDYNVYVDPETCVNYLKIGSGNLLARLNSDGSILVRCPK